MELNELIRLAEGILVIAGIAGVVYAVFRSQTTKQTISSQRDLIDTLTLQIRELRTLHEENSKEIARLTGQVEVYKEIPLKDLAETNREILKILKELKSVTVKG
jgi:hypothetical protein